MPKKIPIIDFSRQYTFSNYFDLPYEPSDILAEFGYSMQRSHLTLARSQQPLPELGALRQRIERVLPYISLSNETARREFLLAPVILDLVYYTHAQLVAEYTLRVTEQLKGSLDYYLYNNSQLLVVEAKKADLDRGFTQLAVELIALDEWTDSDASALTGAVSTGSVWMFGQLERNTRLITQDLVLYTVPENLEDLLRIMVAILNA